jgi:hypothetical protein
VYKNGVLTHEAHKRYLQHIGKNVNVGLLKDWTNGGMISRINNHDQDGNLDGLQVIYRDGKISEITYKRNNSNILSLCLNKYINLSTYANIFTEINQLLNNIAN